MVAENIFTLKFKKSEAVNGGGSLNFNKFEFESWYKQGEEIPKEELVTTILESYVNTVSLTGEEHHLACRVAKRFDTVGALRTRFIIVNCDDCLDKLDMAYQIIRISELDFNDLGGQHLEASYG